ncbi:tRNA pseudouridine(38-40) synthase TruA [Balneolaceae bacterium ANBcel3]|nr:tRNA pseudouridine(38-40) synthase TruA [Balneolaceae bacterium ANBcel3]
MARYALQLVYDGTHFFGWQRQPGHPTVQGALEEALSRVTQQAMSLYGSGRTDTGVHAECQYAHFDSETALDTGDLLHRLNRMLPDSMLIKSLFQVPDDFHARFSAEWRQYRYQLLTCPDPFRRGFAWYPGWEPDPEKLKSCLNLLPGEHDFSGFSKPTPELAHSRCRILHVECYQAEERMLLVRIRANRFLRSMVRGLMAAAVEVSMGKKSVDWFKNHLKEGTKLPNIALAPPGALFLEEVFYPESSFQLD